MCVCVYAHTAFIDNAFLSWARQFNLPAIPGSI